MDTTGRCPWAESAPEYVTYHDTEWGRPEAGDDHLYEKLCLEGFQAGLSWITILRKRPAFRLAFDGFLIDKVAGFGPAEVERLMGDAGIVRNRAKIEAAIGNARVAQAVRDDVGSLAALCWRYEPDPHPPFRTLAELPAVTPESTALSKALRAYGFRFVGPTTIYAFMQSMGMVNDHLVTCPSHAEVEARRLAFPRPGH